MKRLLLLSSMIFLSCCTFFSNYRTVNVKLNPKYSGWYFIKLIKDTTLKDTGTTNINFDDTSRFAVIKINDINKLIVSPFDYNGNSLSTRLQYFGVRTEMPNHNFLQFYNPTDEELTDIDKWNPTNKRARDIMSIGKQTFEKQYTDTIGK